MFAFPIDLFERLLILEDAKQLKNLAVAFLHPEAPIKSDEISKARCYFDRFSAPQQQSFEDTVYIENTLEDALNLKQLAINYMHPEIGIASSNPLTCARCNFSRYSAIEQESVEESEERAVILDDVIKLRQAARQYLYPEEGVVTSYAPSYGRCYFSRYSAIEQESVEKSDERAAILDDAMKLRQAARQYLQPVESVVSSDATSYGRCYFGRYSAIEQESVEESEEHQNVLNDALALKRLAMDYMHPEVRIVTSDLAACARCYFDSISAVRQDSYEEAEEHHKILVDALNLKILAGLSLPKSKTLPNTMELDSKVQNVSKSYSAVHLYGLDDDFVDASYF